MNILIFKLILFINFDNFFHQTVVISEYEKGKLANVGEDEKGIKESEKGEEKIEKEKKAKENKDKEKSNIRSVWR